MIEFKDGVAGGEGSIGHGERSGISDQGEVWFVSQAHQVAMIERWLGMTRHINDHYELTWRQSSFNGPVRG
jgi:hypothetical protein